MPGRDQVGDTPVAARGDFGTVGRVVEAQNDMAVLNTPERRCPTLLSTSRAAEATTGCGPPPPRLRGAAVIIRKVSLKAGSEERWATNTPQRLSSPA